MSVQLVSTIGTLDITISISSNISSQHVNKYLIWAHIRFYFYWADSRWNSSSALRLWGWIVLDRASGKKTDRRLNCVVSCSFLLCNGRLMEEVVPTLGCPVRQPPSLPFSLSFFSLSYGHVSLHDEGISVVGFVLLPRLSSLYFSACHVLWIKWPHKRTAYTVVWE